ncbi:hypothetical protein AB6A40_008729 [Gnathostoma spinigerum]|uniref:Endonuclease/exonuclease/phosphatase domain-containing protein n=1 Tax=Gnathostoma spinigerum TaxID=75299 RepID=A0ABD6F066_9BILA
MTSKSDEECEKALQEFVRITNTDEACAHFFLQDTDWELGPALNNFYAKSAGVKEPLPPKTSSRTEMVDTATTSRKRKISDESFTIMSWNIDGLDRCNLATRFKAVCFVISSVSADAVFLQEVTPELVDDLKSNLRREYSILLATPHQPYFTAVLLKPNVELLDHNVILYETSGMGRAMQIVEGRRRGRHIKLLNTHLESTMECSSIRKEQLNQCFALMDTWKNCGDLAVFGGDLNLRDKEVGGIPSGISDAWISAGSDKNCKFTWDTIANGNKGSIKARCRFDRFYWNSCGPLQSASFRLCGQNRIRSCLCFPSDHWAIVAEFR